MEAMLGCPPVEERSRLTGDSAHKNIRVPAYFAQLPDSVPLIERIQGCPTPSFPPVHVISNGRRIPR